MVVVVVFVVVTSATTMSVFSYVCFIIQRYTKTMHSLRWYPCNYATSISTEIATHSSISVCSTREWELVHLVLVSKLAPATKWSKSIIHYTWCSRACNAINQHEKLYSTIPLSLARLDHRKF